MINNLLKNFCLITFALIAPVTLPAGGIQKNFNQNKFFNNKNEIILSSNASLFSFPEITLKVYQCITKAPLLIFQRGESQPRIRIKSKLMKELKLRM